MSRLPSTLFRACALVLLWAASMIATPARAQLTLTSSFSMSPSSATGGGTISISGSRLDDGRYQVLLLTGRSTVELVDIASGTGEFQRYVRLPTLSAGTYDVELRVDTRLVASRSYKILSPLGVTTSSTTPRAGSSLAFTVTGLTKGSLTLYYAGKSAWGPVNVEAGSYSGKLVVPTDRPATLPADVVLQARNTVGRTVPRVGSRTLSVQAPDRNPIVRIGSSSTGTSSTPLRQRLDFTGSLATNDLEPGSAAVQYWWRGADGRVMPMGAQQSAVGSDGSFSAKMLAPQVGTLSAGRAAGTGSVFAVGQARDRNGVQQQRPGLVSPMTVAIDTDAAIDINLVLQGSDNLRIPGARVVLATSQLDELYPPNDNGSPVRLDGGVPFSEMPSQFGGATASDSLLGCPDDLERQTSDGSGRAAFEFGLSLPAQGYNVDGSGPAPSVTILPSEDCTEIPANPTGGNQTASQCTLVDPAGIHATITVIAAHTGYGWLTQPQGNAIPVERPLTVALRIDRYTGSVETNVCVPDTTVNYGNLSCEKRTFQRSANLTLTLPKLPINGLLMTDPLWTQGAYVTWPEVAGREGLILDYKPMPDLAAFEGKARFTPTVPYPRVFQIGYVRGAGNRLEFARLYLPGRDPIDLAARGGSDSCDVSATEIYGVDSTQNAALAGFLDDLRYPGTRFPGKSSVLGYVVAREEGTQRTAVRPFRFKFAKTKVATAAIADAGCPAGVAAPCLVIDASKPHYAKVTPPPADPESGVDTGNGNTDGCDGPDCDDYSELKSKRNEAVAHLDLQFCLPEGSNGCGSLSQVDSSHQQFSRQSDAPPPGASFGGAAGASQTDAPWKVLFDKTIPLFRWYWGVPEIFSAEVFADLGLKAEYLFNYVVKPLAPLQSYVETGGRMDILITIGVDVDVLFGILVDAGAAITGVLSGEVVAKAEAATPASPCIDTSLDFGLDFSYWVEIGCPIPNPFDPTCYIPDIEGSHNIFSENIASNTSCLANERNLAPWDRLEDKLARLRTGEAMSPKQAMAVSPAVRRAMNRHPAISVDSAGNRQALYIDSLGKLVASDQPVDGARTTSTLSQAHGLRDVAVMHYADDRAVAVWAQSDVTSAAGQPIAADLASRQHLRYAVFNGDSWGAARQLTAPGFGEGGVRLARCKPRAFFYRSDCDANKVSVVFQRNTARRTGGESHIYLMHFDGSSWSPPQRVDTSGTHNITPAIAYRNAQPVVAWVRYAPDTTGRTDAEQLSDFGARNLALRVMDGNGAEEIDTRLSRVAQPDLATTSDNRLAVAFTRAASTAAFVGTRQALYLGERTCANGTCTLGSFAVRDVHGRLVYGERPRLAANAAGGVSVLFRGLAFGARAGAPSTESNFMPGDPLGVLTTRGELFEVRSLLTTGTTHALALTNDARGHLQGAIAFDPAAQEVIALSASLPQDAAISKRAETLPPALAKVEAVDDGVLMSSVGDLPDLAVVALTAPVTRLTPGATFTATAMVENLGSEWTPAEERIATLRVYWDEPQARETLYGNLAIPAMAPGERRSAAVTVTVPAAFASDERQSLRAELVIESDEGELQGGNNAMTLAIGGMPVPANLRALSTPGSRIVNLAWDDPADARVAGYRIWVDDEQGVPQPIGSSFHPGFADLSALFGFERRYRVSTYSARGVESEPSAVIVASPALAVSVEGDGVPEGPAIFDDGFE